MQSDDKRLWPKFVAEPVGGGPLGIYEIMHARNSVGNDTVPGSHFYIREKSENDSGATWMSLDGEVVGKHGGSRPAEASEYDAHVLKAAVAVAARHDGQRLYRSASLAKLKRIRGEEEAAHKAAWKGHVFGTPAPKTTNLPRPPHARVRARG